jgi:hypothetical protein
VGDDYASASSRSANPASVAVRRSGGSRRDAVDLGDDGVVGQHPDPARTALK